ncbi:autotransporter outer membrane beta-barrel domain-containing protein [Amorphus orientalis]|uniref:Autotransporter-associated beta strand protein n=1 Tax=Amorphus orientalis TaxID=649198 RepID=A0AAE3VS80_9HYPH|nr:autotransporter domain-containing protein [Amorphus orientalis]MDQ0317240.1 autotransporter-associated beta strand protein [Amorphus orientalis]
MDRFNPPVRRFGLRAFGLATALAAASLASPAAAQSWSLYDDGDTSFTIPKSPNSRPDSYEYDLKITTTRRDGTSVTSAARKIEMDTGSTGLVIAAEYLGETADTLTGEAGWAFYNSSGLLIWGKLTEATVTYLDPATGQPIVASNVRVLAATNSRCTGYGDNPCDQNAHRTISMMGVGFGRNTLGEGALDYDSPTIAEQLIAAPTTSQAFNPLVNIAAPDGSAFNQGYIIRRGEVIVGLTPANTSGFAFGKLEADSQTGAWGQGAMSVTVSGGSEGTVGPQSGILLADTGIPNSFIHVPGQASGPVSSASTVTVQVLDAGDTVSYSYRVGCTSACSPQKPTSVQWVGPSATDRGVGYVNTGIRFYDGFYYLFDPTNGYLGVAPDPNVSGTNIVFTPVISAIGQITFDTPFSTTMPVFLRASSTNPAAIATGTTATFENALTGPGDLIVNGTGTVTLNGVNTYSGHTTVQSGTLAVTSQLASAVTVRSGGTFNLSGQLSVAGATAPLVTVDTGGAFDLAGTVSGNVSNFGTTTVQSSGRIAGDVSTAGSFVNNGTVSGTLTTTGRLSGTGTVANLVVAQGGTLATGNSIGTMTVTGTYTFGPGATREVEVGADGSIDLLRVSGTATLSGGTVIVSHEPGLVPVLGDRYVFLTADGGVTGTHSNLVGGLFDDALYPFLTTGLSYGATDAALQVVDSQVSFEAAGTTPNRRAVGAALDRFVQGTALDYPLTHLTIDQYNLAADQLSGQIHASTLTALQNDARLARDTIQARLGAAFAEMGAAPMFASNGTSGMNLPGLTASAWASAYGNWGDIDGTGNASSLSTSLTGTLAGVDAAIHTWGRVGFAAGYGAGRFKSPDLAASGTSGTTTLAAYGGAVRGMMRASLGASFAWHDIETDRTIAFPGYWAQQSADHSATTGQIFGEGAIDLGFAPVDTEAFAGLAFVQTSTDAFSEGGDLTALSATGATQSNTLTTLGLRLAKSVPLAGGVLRPHATLGWQHAFGDVDPDMDLTFARSGAGFTVAGAPIARDAAIVGAGLDFVLTRRATLSVAYDGRIGSGTAEHAATGELSVTF